MTAQSIFTRQADRFLPTAHATGPWGADRLHGGPVLGLLVRELEQALQHRQLIDGEPTTALQRMAALSDFTNAIASISACEREQSAIPYINTDTTLYLWRQPVGEWFCLQEQTTQASRGVSLAEIALHDAHGALGRALQARLAYTRS